MDENCENFSRGFDEMPCAYLVDKTLGDFVTIAWKKYKPRFAEARKSDQYLGEYFQWLAERMDEYSKSAPREPFYMTKEKTIRRRAS